jgi:hypothetical protein
MTKLKWPDHSIRIPAPTVVVTKGTHPEFDKAAPIMIKLWPPNGVPPESLTEKVARALVDKIYQPKFKRPLPRTTYRRIVAKLKLTT